MGHSGIIDPATGVVLSFPRPGQMTEWKNVPLQHMLEQEFAMPCILEDRLSAFGSAAEDGGASKAEPASAALIAVANSCGVRYPKLLCGRSSLYSRFRAELVHQIAEDVGSNNTQVKRT